MGDLKYPEHLAEMTDAISTSMPDLDITKAAENSRTAKNHTFQLDFTDGRGKQWQGTFTNKILSLREHQMVGILRARLAGGLPVESLDAMTLEINLMIAHLTYSLTERPDWAKDLQTLEDVRVLQELYREVLLHENTFLGYGINQEQSTEER